MGYKKGLHIIATLRVSNESLLRDSNSFKHQVNDLVQKHELVQVGETYHSFPEFGYTATVCLTESHISIHTWPEFGLATFDVFLSNFKQDNTLKVRDIYESITHFFHAEIEQYEEIER